jgi:uncharacterized protein YjbI with pentapeptide repeats
LGSTGASCNRCDRGLRQCERLHLRLNGANLSGANLSGSDLYGIDLSRTSLREADLHEADLGHANLRGAKLTGANLINADLRGAYLSGAGLIAANFDHANLSGADLREAYLNGANLSGADLSGADLSGADLSGAKLNDANLREADLNGASLIRANVTGTTMWATIMANTDLSDAIGLEAVRHRGPSSIGIDTFYKSQGSIPDEFLQDAGVPKDFIAYARSLINKPFEFYSCFISYSEQGREFAERLRTDLVGGGVRCWLFSEDAKWGETVWGEIDRSIKIYDKLVVVCSENALQSAAVLREIERGLQREDLEKKNVLFPIRIDDYIFEEWEHERKADVVKKVVGDFRHWKDYDAYQKSFARLLKDLRAEETKKA